MHEMSLCQSVLQMLEEQAAVHSYTRVKAVWLEIGPLAGVEPEAMMFCFDAVTRGTLAENARFEIVHTQAKAWCMGCSKSVDITNRFDSCPDCGSYQLQITGGDELRIKQMEVD
ncbi:MAG: hydrogenase maturation nickel metallochaperone HypA [Rhodomicrobium sp.]